MSSEWPAIDQVFILRFWREEAGTAHQMQWRVQVQNVNTRQRQVVNDVERALAIVTERLKTAGEEGDHIGGTNDA